MTVKIYITEEIRKIVNKKYGYNIPKGGNDRFVIVDGCKK